MLSIDVTYSHMCKIYTQKVGVTREEINMYPVLVPFLTESHKMDQNTMSCEGQKSMRAVTSTTYPEMSSAFCENALQGCDQW